jgi:hypothetical protein
MLHLHPRFLLPHLGVSSPLGVGRRSISLFSILVTFEGSVGPCVGARNDAKTARASFVRTLEARFFILSYLQEVGPTRQINRIDLQKGASVG